MATNMERNGAFKRLNTATRFLRLFSGNNMNLMRQLEVYIREQVIAVESLSLYMIDFKQLVLFRHHPIGVVRIHSLSASLDWIAIQIVFAILSGNSTTIVVSAEHSCILEKYITNVSHLVEIAVEAGEIEVPDGVIQFSHERSLLYDSTSTISLASVFPSLSQLVVKDIQISTLFMSVSGTADLVDEFDILHTLDREVYIQQRQEYILDKARNDSEYYSSIIASPSNMSQIPCIDGAILTSHVPPYGSGLLTDSAYSVAFCSGGTTGRPKFVYRNQWEDYENSRYLGKGLAASGITKNDVIAICLESAFWGGLHVFNLAFTALGCSVIQLGAYFPHAQTVDFIQKLKPTAILALPSWLLSLAEYVLKEGCEVSVAKVISGGEKLFDAAKNKIRLAFHVTEFLSTGYTSNETGATAFQCKELAQASTSIFHIHENMQYIEILPIPDTADQVQNQQAPQLGVDTFTSEVDGSAAAVAVGEVASTAADVAVSVSLDSVSSTCEHALEVATTQVTIGSDALSPTTLTSAATASTPSALGFQSRVYSNSSAVGRIIATNLNRTLMPMIRYEIGDIGRMIPGSCKCGRTLRMMELCGRFDGMIRLGGENLYVEDVSKAVASVSGLSVLFQLHVYKSERQRDLLVIHVESSSAEFVSGDVGREEGECAGTDGSPRAEDKEVINGDPRPTLLISALASCTRLVWSEERGAMERPQVIVLPPGGIPRNPRTGKISLIIDSRAK